MIQYLSHAKPSALRGRTALLRLDFNTEDDWRMRAVLPTITLLLKHCRSVVIVSHKGRPNGYERRLSLKKNAATLSRLLGKKVIFIPHFDFAEIKKTLRSAPAGSVFLLENLRFTKGEEKNDPAFAKQLASLADVYVNDAFAVSHRANASVAAITKFLPHYAGLELEREIGSLGKAMRTPKHPVVFILGGAKAADKLGVIAYFTKKADWFLLGGGPANTILALRGMDVKRSTRDTEKRDVRMMEAFSHYKSVIVPVDFVWSGQKILDIGPRTAQLFAQKIATARTIIWSGPLGLIEKKQYAKASVRIARAIRKNRKAFSLSGGGETVSFLKQYKLDTAFSFISTGGGAMVDFLAGKKLPGIEALKK